MDKSLLPAIISQTLYIDLYNNGLENTLRQLVDVIQGNNIFRPVQKFSNLIAKVKKEQDSVSVEISAEYYLEPHSRYLILVDNKENELTWDLHHFSEYTSGFNNDIKFSDGIHNCILIEVTSPTSPNFPIRVILRPLQKDIPVKVLYVMHAISRTGFQGILTSFI